MGKASRAKRAEKTSPSETGPSTRTRVIVGAIVGVICVAIIAVAFLARPKPATPEALPTPDASAALPQGVFDSKSEFAYGWQNGTPDASVPTIVLWEDFQCPGCKALEDQMGSVYKAIAAEGTANVIYRPTAFLDLNLGGDSSVRATAAFGCAIDAGKGIEYHDVIYANQPETEGTGYTDAQLIGFGYDAGIEGAELETFKKCVADKTYRTWPVNSTDMFFKANIQGTPTVLLNGVSLDSSVYGDETALRAEIAKVAAGGTVDAGTDTPVSVPSATPSATPSAS